MPFDKRLAYDGRGLQDVHINDKPAKVSESLYVVEEKAREEVAVRNKVHEEMCLKEKKVKEQELRALAQKARLERTGVAMAIPPEEKDFRHSRESEECMRREKVCKERMRERERERRLAAKDGGMGKRSKITRDRDCDINEKVALGMSPTKTEVMYDKRLFNQDKGMSSGFACDDQYNVYESGLITAQATLSTLYRPKKDIDCDAYGGADEQMEKIMTTDRFKPDKGFTGTLERRGPKDMPVEFENEEADPFGLDQFLKEVKKGKN